MPKERRERSLSFERSRVSPFHCSSSRSKQLSSRNPPPETPEDVKEWEEARCPVCMEHPHNAVLLLCSSHDKGCRPYMCDTSYRHSNCLDQFCKAFTESPPTPTAASLLSGPLAQRTSPEEQHVEQHHEGEDALPSMLCELQDQPKLSCPLCRGQIKGWERVEAVARQFMNAKTRSCAQESCTFNGTYADLRKHARLVHPTAHPSEVDPQRQRDWRRLERQRDLGDVLSTFQSAFGEERDEESFYDRNWLTVFLLIRVFPSGSSTRTSWSVPSRFRGLSRSRRRTTLWGESYDGEPARDDETTSEGVSGSWRRHERSQRQTMSDDEQ